MSRLLREVLPPVPASFVTSSTQHPIQSYRFRLCLNYYGRRGEGVRGEKRTIPTQTDLI